MTLEATGALLELLDTGQLSRVVSSDELAKMPENLSVRAPAEIGRQQSRFASLENALGGVGADQRIEALGQQLDATEREALKRDAQIEEEGLFTALFEVDDGGEPTIAEDRVVGKDIAVHEAPGKRLREGLSQSGGLLTECLEHWPQGYRHARCVTKERVTSAEVECVPSRGDRRFDVGESADGSSDDSRSRSGDLGLSAFDPLVDDKGT